MFAASGRRACQTHSALLLRHPHQPGSQARRAQQGWGLREATPGVCLLVQPAEGPRDPAQEPMLKRPDGHPACSGAPLRPEHTSALSRPRRQKKRLKILSGISKEREHHVSRSHSVFPSPAPIIQLHSSPHSHSLGGRPPLLPPPPRLLSRLKKHKADSLNGKRSK